MTGLIILMIAQWIVIAGGAWLMFLMRKNETRLVNEAIDRDEKLDAMRSLTSDFIPNIEQLIIALREAKVGSSSQGRRKKRRKVFRKAHELKIKMEEAA